MINRRKRATAKNKTFAYIGAGLVHALIIAALIFNFSSETEQVELAIDGEVKEIVKGNVVSEADIKKAQDKIRDDEQERKRKNALEQKRLDELRKERVKEESQIKKLKTQQEEEKKKAAELEKKRKQIALQNQKDEKRREQVETERKRVEKEQRQVAEAERIKKEQEELESERRLQEAIAAEAAFMADKLAKQRTTTLVSKYSALIKQKIVSVWTISPDFERWRETKVNIKLSPLGDVISTRILKSSGSERYDRSVETAILNASPLPLPDLTQDPDANNQLRNLNLNFPMPGT